MNVRQSDEVLPGLFDQSTRETIRLTLGGDSLCLRFSNEHGSGPVHLGAASVAPARPAGAVDPGSASPVTFGGRSTGVIRPGAVLVSDPIALATVAGDDVAVSAYYPDYTPIDTHHFPGQETTLISRPGNHVRASSMPLQGRTTSRYFLAAAYVAGARPGRTVVCFGDSITTGEHSTVDGHSRWPDRLAERMRASEGFEGVSVVNQGISGNRLLTGEARGASGLARFGRDVLSFPRVSHVVVQIGINDIGWPGTPVAGETDIVSADDIIGGYRQLIGRCRLHGLRVLLATLTPFAGAFEDDDELPLASFHTEAKEERRRRVNDWILGQDEADGVLDFDDAVRSGSEPSRLEPRLDSGDHLHPNDTGYRAIADSIDLSLLADAGDEERLDAVG